MVNMDFYRAIFRYVQSRHIPEPDMFSVTNIQVAVSALRECSGMTYDHMANRLCLSKTQLLHLESKGRPINQTTILKLKAIALEHGLPVLADYFNRQDLKIRAKINIRVPANKIGSTE
jgi:transcriptional regulator with XRE-family HTH domain